MKYKTIHEATQSNHAVFAGFNHVKFCRFPDGFFINLCMLTAANIPQFAFEKEFVKNFIF